MTTTRKTILPSDIQVAYIPQDSCLQANISTFNSNPRLATTVAKQLSAHYGVTLAEKTHLNNVTVYYRFPGLKADAESVAVQALTEIIAQTVANAINAS